MREQVNSDELTGCLNRRGLDKYIKNFESEGKQLSYIFIDVNGFKQINDKYGHLFGDKVLVELAKKFKSILRGGDVIARYGGDEFVVALEKSDKIVEAEILKRLIDSTSDLTLECNNQKVGVTISAGIGEQVESADKLMYQMKNRPISLE
jgi:diguanylate cyclase (GGDEF)-like protein